MFTLEVEKGLNLALVEPKFAPLYLDIVSKQRGYLSEWLAWPSHADNTDFFISFVKRSLHEYAEGNSMVCAMIYHDELVGNISFNTIDYQLHKVQIGYWLSKDHQGKGIISKSVAKLIEIAFENLDMQKVEISVAVDNQPSRKVCERLGFTLEGILTRAENLNGRIIDHALYGLTRNMRHNSEQ